MLPKEFIQEHLPNNRINLFKAIIGSRLIEIKRRSRVGFDEIKKGPDPTLFYSIPRLLNLNFDNGLSLNISGMDFIRSFFVHRVNHAAVGYDNYGFVWDGEELTITDPQYSSGAELILGKRIDEIALIKHKTDQPGKVRGIKFIFEGRYFPLIFSHYLTKTSSALSIIPENDMLADLDGQLEHVTISGVKEKENYLLLENVIEIVNAPPERSELIRYDLMDKGIYIEKRPDSINHKTADQLLALKSVLQKENITIADPEVYVLPSGKLVLHRPIDIIENLKPTVNIMLIDALLRTIHV